MAIAEFELTYTDQEEAVWDTVHRFADEVMRPAGAQLDRLDPEQVIAPDSVLWTVFRKYQDLGFEELDSNPELHPLVRARLKYLIYEEMGWGDAGLAISLAVSDFHRTLVRLFGGPSVTERFCVPGTREIGCWAITEPDHGSDSLALTEPHFRDPSVRAECIVRRDGDDLVIRGVKSAWVSNGTIADAAALFVTIDGDQGFRGGGVVIVPLDLPGVSRGKPVDKLGQRALNQGEIIFDDVRVPADYLLVGGPDAYPIILEMVLTVANAAMGCVFTGVARSAYEHALAYAKERVQGGVPIINHQSVKSRLFKMFTSLEAAQALSRHVMVHNNTQPPLSHYSIASKTFCTTTAFQIASEAVQIFGGNGLTREYPVEKLLRDARASMIEDGCNEVLSLIGASKLDSNGTA